MARRLLIDLTKCRNCQDCEAKCSYDFHPNNNGVMRIKELAAFSVTCRKCKSAPCIEVCPAEALEKDEDMMVIRSVNLCISCKSCVAICPFGTLMNDLFEVRTSICDYCNSRLNGKELPLCTVTCSEQALRMIEDNEEIDQHVRIVNDQLLVKDFTWEYLSEN